MRRVELADLCTMDAEIRLRAPAYNRARNRRGRNVSAGGGTGVAVQPAASRIGPGTAANFLSGAAGVGREQSPGTLHALCFLAPTDAVNNQHLFGYNAASGAGYQYLRSNGRAINLIWTTGTFVTVMTVYKMFNLLLVYRNLAGNLRVTANGEVTRGVSNPSGGYTNAGGTGVFGILKNAFAGTQTATENSLIWSSIVDFSGGDPTDAQLQAWSNQINLLDCFHAPAALQGGQAGVLDYKHADDWDGVSSFTGSGSAPTTLTRNGALGKFAIPGYDWRDVPEQNVSDSSGILGTQGASGETGVRRSSLAQVSFTTDASDNVHPGMIVEALSSVWLAGQTQTGLYVNGTGLAGNNVGNEPIPGGVPAAGYGLRRRMGAPIGGVGAKTVVLVDGGQPKLGAAPQSQGTVTRVGVISGSSFAWVAKATTNKRIINSYDSRGTQTENVSDVPGAKGPCYNAYPIKMRANAAAAGWRVTCEGWGSGTWFERISGANLAVYMAIMAACADGVTDNVWVDWMGVNDHIQGTYGSIAAFQADYLAMLQAKVALAKPGTRMFEISPVTYINAALTINGMVLADYATGIQNAVTALGNPNVVFADGTNAVSLVNRTDAQQLHWNDAGAGEAEAFIRGLSGGWY